MENTWNKKRKEVRALTLESAMDKRRGGTVGEEEEGGQRAKWSKRKRHHGRQDFQEVQVNRSNACRGQVR